MYLSKEGVIPLKSKRTILMASVAALVLAFTACQNQPKTDQKAAESKTDIKQVQTKDETNNANEEKDIQDKKENEVVKIENPKVSEFADKVFEKVKKHWPHMNKIWPTYDYTKHNLILFHLDENGEPTDAWKINIKGINKLQATEYENIDYPQANGYSNLDYQGNKSIAMSFDDESLKDLDKSANTLHVTASHELVHFYYQGKSEVSGSRTQPYPVEKTPRQYRYMVMKNLEDAYKNPENKEKALGQAKYWYEKWKTEFPNEYNDIKATDIAEGTAKYTEYLSEIVNDKISKEDIKKAVLKLIDIDNEFLSADAESYEMGALSALLLDEQNPDWKNKFYESNTTLEELLLKDVKAVEEKMNPEIEKKINENIESFNVEVEKNLENITKAYGDVNIPYLKINKTESNASFGSEGVFKYKNHEVASKYSATFGVIDKTIKINRLSSIEEFDDTNDYVIVPLTMEHSVKNGVLTVKSNELEVNGVEVKTEKDSEGRTIYSVKVDK